MCYCTPVNRTPNCGSEECQRLAEAAEVFGVDAPEEETPAPQPIPTDDKLEIPAFLRRPNGKGDQEEKDAPAEDNQADGPVPVPLLGLQTEAHAESGAPASDEGTAAAEDLELALPEAPTLASLEKAIRDLREKRKRKVAEWDETIRLLKAQAKKMVDKL